MNRKTLRFYSGCLLGGAAGDALGAPVEFGSRTGIFARGVRIAVNYSGDSTSAIIGNILGALLGKDAIPAGWLERLQMHNEIEEISRDLLAGFEDNGSWWEKYSGW